MTDELLCSGVAATHTSGERREDRFAVFIVVNKYNLFYLLSVVQLLQTLSDGLQQPWAGTNHKLGI